MRVSTNEKAVNAAIRSVGEASPVASTTSVGQARGHGSGKKLEAWRTAAHLH